MDNPFQEFFATYEIHTKRLVDHLKARDKHPALQTLTTSSFIALKMKAEYNAMALYYRKVALPNAQDLLNRMKQEYEGSKVKSDYAELDRAGLFDDCFEGVLREAIMAGYIAISHKIENLVALVENHSVGKQFGVLDIPTYGIVDYVAVLKDEFGISFRQLLEEEPRNKPAHVHEVITPRIHRIRMTANRIKHQDGYPKDKDDFIINYFPGFADYPKNYHRQRIPFTVDEFLVDLYYADHYLDVVLDLIDSLHVYAMGTTIAKKPLGPDDSSAARDSVLNVTIPSHHAKVILCVATLKHRDLDRFLTPENQLPHPSSFTKLIKQ